jgi:hypothetical protein
MVGDICDEDELKTGYRAEGSYYSVFWWFIKMGSALASFVAGALIVLTMFDETQVTKVDKIQGSVREMQKIVQYWKGYQGLNSTNKEWLGNTKVKTAEALTESKEYLTYLDKESLKEPDKANQILPAYPGQRKTMLSNAILTTKTTVSELEQIQSHLVNLSPTVQDSLMNATVVMAIPLTLQTKLLKARMYSFELKSHLEAKSQETKNSKEHYADIMQKITRVNNRLNNMNMASSMEILDKELSAIKNNIVPLTKQTPYTLLMMRVVEIGLPLFLSLFSIFFVLRYSLTEKRSHEIKDLLRQRNQERSKEDGTGSEPVIG